MLRQDQLLFDTVLHERALALSPVRLERRRIANLLEALRCCSGPSVIGRLRGALDSSATSC